MKTMKTLLVSRDPVTADAAAARMFGAQPEGIRHIEIAAQMKLGRMDLENLNINRITL